MTRVSVGIVANPASGRDIRRLVAGASVFGNTEKGSMVYRVLVGLGAVGVDRALLMPAGPAIGEGLGGQLRGNAWKGEGAQRLPEVQVLDMVLCGDARDTTRAVAEMRRQGVAALVVLGGDGTNRAVAQACGEVPVCSLSTGTNNAFPELREATISGLAAGLVAARRSTGCLRREKVLRVAVNGDRGAGCALVDVAVCAERFVGARALWRAADVSQVFVAFASPAATGFSGLAGLLQPVPRSADFGLHLTLGDPALAPTTLRVPLAPGLMEAIGVLEAQRLAPGRPVELA
ncbi:MAG: NAD(+)/NADH kinase, partial [Candidatus Dormibacteraceae bacterium]